MKFFTTSAIFAAVAALAVSAKDINPDVLSEVSKNWGAVSDVVAKDLPMLKGVMPDVYNQATQAIGGTALPPSFDEGLVSRVANTLPEAVLKLLLSKAGIEGDPFGQPTGATETAEPQPSGSTPPTPSSSPSTPPAPPGKCKPQ
ncbi:hypothetical protein H4219_003482 [Mycoemilia scoparia]|uniref:Uncharacterized protein n=1 Tax=Mycoemilia scoparia TaxID=417184 RepID=A0A9W8A145_9FUNG|nr:hypothetical protein H4219_003482 [Mycoemilia scoparia]